MFHHRQIGREKHPLEGVFFIKRRGQVEDLQVTFGGGSHDQLCALSRRGKPGRVAVFDHVLPALGNAVPEKAHGRQNILPLFVGRQQLQTGLRGQLDVDAHAVGQQPQLGEQRGTGPRNGLGVDITVKMVFLPQDAQGLQHELAGVVGIVDHRAGQKQSLDVVAAVKLHGQIGQLPGREGSAPGVVGAAVDAIGAVIAAGVALQHFQQGDAPPVGRKTVAAAAGHGCPQSSGSGSPIHAAGGAGGIVFGGIGQNGQFFQHIHSKPLQNQTFVR